jgi:hypothetical protein
MASRQERVEAFLKQHCAALTRLCRRKYGLPKSWRPELTIDWSPRRNEDWGGTLEDDTPFINLAARMIKARTFKEYAHYADDPEIGSARCRSWKSYALAILTHEIVHCVQWTKIARAAARGIRKRKNDGNHGEDFQRIYRALRNEYANRRMRRHDRAAAARLGR